MSLAKQPDGRLVGIPSCLRLGNLVKSHKLYFVLVLALYLGFSEPLCSSAMVVRNLAIVVVQQRPTRMIWSYNPGFANVSFN